MMQFSTLEPKFYYSIYQVLKTTYTGIYDSFFTQIDSFLTFILINFFNPKYTD